MNQTSQPYCGFTYIRSLSYESLLCVQNMFDASHQLEGAAVISALQTRKKHTRKQV